MNVFEMFGFFMLGSIFNMIIILIFVLIVGVRIKESIDSSVEKVILSTSPVIGRVEKIVNLFSKGEKNV